MASQWSMMWWKLPPPQDRGGLGRLPARAALRLDRCRGQPRWIAPYELNTRSTPPTSTRRRSSIHLFHEGSFVGPFVYGYTVEKDLKRMQRIYTVDETKVQPLRFFCFGDRYRFWGLVDMPLPFRLPVRARARGGRQGAGHLLPVRHG
jgi:peptide/nickel transport system permease protein